MATLDSDGNKLIQHWEGLSLKIYYDQAGIPTIGYGHAIRSTLELSKYKNGIDLATAQQLFINDVKTAVNSVNRLVTVPLTQYQFNALVSFEFNTGGLNGSHLLRYVNAKNFILAAKEFYRWDHFNQHGKLVESDGLLHRRRAESYIFMGNKLSDLEAHNWLV